MDTEILMGIDYGESKIGTALGRNDLVMPLNEINGKNEMSAVHEITRLVMENKVSRIIMGLPVTADGKDTYQARKVRRFSKLLKAVSKKPIVFSNEYRTTKESMEEGYDKNLLVRGNHEDTLAAALILKRYYNERD